MAAHIGDAILTFIIRDCIGHADGKTKAIIATNAYLTQRAKALGISPIGGYYAGTQKQKLYADAVEEMIYRLYKKHGIDFVHQWVRVNIIEQYKAVKMPKKPSIRKQMRKIGVSNNIQDWIKPTETSNPFCDFIF